MRAGLCDTCAHQKLVRTRPRQRLLHVPALEDRRRASRSTRACPWSAAAATRAARSAPPVTTVLPSSATRTSGASSEIVPANDAARRRAAARGRPPWPCRRGRRPRATRSCKAPALHRGHRPPERLLPPRLQRPAGPGVHVGGVAAARGRVLRLGEAADLDLHAVDRERGPVGVGERPGRRRLR